MRSRCSLASIGCFGFVASPTRVSDEYQHNDAWTWEASPLRPRARMIYGDEQLASAFNKTRHEVLCLSRDEATLKKRW
ncbi:hypothetical protein OK016_11665 [Vibrio chagasii]|nr:hypothetical protein [Vibrio chagasii]